MTEPKKGAPGSFRPKVGRVIGALLAHGWWRTEVVHASKVPQTGPVVLVANHVGFIDGPLVHGVSPRPTHFLVKEEMFRGMLGWILTASGQIEVRGSGREALSRARQVLQRQGAVGVFPQGTRSGAEVSTIHGGAAWLAVNSGATVVPVAVFGTRLTGESVHLWPRFRRPLRVEFGASVSLDSVSHLRGKERQREAEKLVAETLRLHVADAVTRSDIPLPTDDPSVWRRHKAKRAKAHGTP